MFAGVFIVFFLIVIVVGGGVLVAHILYLLMLSRTIELCAEHNRRMPPGHVWMVFIPIYGIIYYFMMVGYVADTIAAEYRYRNWQCEEERPGYQYGLWSMILRCCGIIPFLGILAGITGLVFWIMHWSRIASYKKTLEQAGPSGRMGNPYHGYQQYPQYPQYPQYQNYPPQNYPPQQAQFPPSGTGSSDIHL